MAMILSTLQDIGIIVGVVVYDRKIDNGRMISKIPHTGKIGRENVQRNSLDLAIKRLCQHEFVKIKPVLHTLLRPAGKYEVLSGLGTRL